MSLKKNKHTQTYSPDGTITVRIISVSKEPNMAQSAHQRYVHHRNRDTSNYLSSFLQEPFAYNPKGTTKDDDKISEEAVVAVPEKEEDL